MKCTGKFKEDFEAICASKNNLKYIPEVVTRSKRPGSAQQHQTGSQQAETSLGKADGKKTSNQPKGKTTVVTVEAVDETELNIGLFYIYTGSFAKIEILKKKVL